ncbi:MAG: tRNA uridine-5-carboxymethylaminomethyl(34) synthesis GTPase MnmE [Clostridiales bacterium]|nr:tRNA uridine-5-carboxymethylaminomethyl(34) synthesis GTPase MnmE [Clostridiales bacterium]
MEKPYCACATPPGVSGIAVIRIAGEGSAAVTDKVVRIRRAAGDAKTVAEMAGYTLAYGTFIDPSDETVIDEVMLTRFCAPHSYTGEESVEISCHGGLTVRQEILRVLLENGARMAGPGEFTKRAFMAGKLDLSQAEAVMDVIAADSELALRAAESQLSGSLKEQVENISAVLYLQLSLFEMFLDEIEEEDDNETKIHYAEELENSVYKRLSELTDSYKQGRILSERMKIVICGIPNSGKSSLLNCLSGYDRAIVTDVPGTTRDTLEVITSIRGIPVKLIDTAGIRKTDDVVEAIGVDRANAAIGEADIVLWLVSTDEEEKTITDLIDPIMTLPKETKIALLISKSDTSDEETVKKQEEKVMALICQKGYSRVPDLCGSLSSATGEGLSKIEEFIRNAYDEMGATSSVGLLVTNRRHFEVLSSALEKVGKSIAALRRGDPLEGPALLIRAALEDVGEITGKSVSDTLVDTIFSRFCVGK